MKCDKCGAERQPRELENGACRTSVALPECRDALAGQLAAHQYYSRKVADLLIAANARAERAEKVCHALVREANHESFVWTHTQSAIALKEWKASRPEETTCAACSIESEIGDADDPHPVPKRFHTCAERA